MLTSLRDYPNAHTVLHRMAEDAERGRRIAELKAGRPDLTWARIAAKVGVAERSALNWAAKGGISYENCQKLAGIFDVDGDWLYSGRRRGDATAPQPLKQLDRIEQAVPVAARPQLDRIEQKLELLVRLAMAAVPQEVRDALRFEQALEDIERESDQQDRRGLGGEGETG